jgi:hypothetical protein
MNTALWQNYLTTIFGILAGGPILVQQSFSAMGVALSPNWTHGLLIMGAVGLIGLGVVSKAFNVHSTTSQVQTSTTQNPKVEAAAIVQAKVAAVEAPIIPKP